MKFLKKYIELLWNGHNKDIAALKQVRILKGDNEMQNEVWNKIGMFLNSLRCENVNRSSYIHLSEMKEAEQLKKAAYEEFVMRMEMLETDQRQVVENYIEVLQHRAFVAEKQAYCQGYVDCIQLLAGIGLLENNPDIEKLVGIIKK